MGTCSILRKMAAVFVYVFIFCVGAAGAQEIETLIKAGDQLYKKRSTNRSAIYQAIGHWNKAVALNPSDALPSCRIAMAYRYMSRFPIDEESRVRDRQKAFEYAQKALAANSGDACGHYWFAVVQYERTQGKAPTQYFRALGEINSHLNKAKAANDKIYDGGPDRLLGHIAYKSPIVKLTAATEHLEAALAISPNHHENLIAYADVMVRRKRFRDARMALNKLMALHAAPGEERELSASKLKAKLLLESIAD